MYKKPYRHIYQLGRFVLRPFYVWWNRIKLSANDVKYGEHCRIFNKFFLHTRPTSQVVIGNNFTFSSGANFNQLSRSQHGSIYVDWNGSLFIGDNVGISSASLWCIDTIRIGNHVNIGADTIIIDHDAHSLDYRIRREREGCDVRPHKPIVIDDDVFIGSRCIILKGVKIGARSIIGAGSVVSGSIPPDCIAAGNPCKIIKYINR